MKIHLNNAYNSQKRYNENQSPSFLRFLTIFFFWPMKETVLILWILWNSGLNIYWQYRLEYNFI